MTIRTQRTRGPSHSDQRISQDRIEILKAAISDGVRYSEGQDRDLCALRNRSMQLLQVLIVGASIAFGVTLNHGTHVEEWIPILLLIALVVCTGVAAYIAHPVPNFDVPGNITAGVKAYKRGTSYEEYLLASAKAIKAGKNRNKKILRRRYRAFECLAYFLGALVLAAGVCYLITHF